MVYFRMFFKMYFRMSQIGDFVFCSGFNFANITCHVVELGSINLIISTSWHVKFAKLRPLWRALEKARSSTVALTPSNPLTTYLYPRGFRKAFT